MRNEYENAHARMSIRESLAGPLMVPMLYTFNTATYLAVSWKYFETLPRGQDTIPWFIVTGLIYTLGAITDTASTIVASETATLADMAGVKHNVVETNPLLPERPTRRDLLRGRNLAKDIAILPFGIAFPPLGITIGISRMAAAISNTHTARYLEGKITERKRLRDAARKPITNIEEAGNILQAVVLTNESSITSQTPVDRVANFSIRRIREAIAVAGTDLMGRYPVVEDARSYIMTKPLGHDKGGATLTFSKLPRREIIYDADRYWSVKLDAGPLHAEVPLQMSYRINTMSFTDDRGRYSRSAFPSSLRESLSVADHRRLLRGMRWVSANILEWEKPSTIMPE